MDGPKEKCVSLFSVSLAFVPKPNAKLEEFWHVASRLKKKSKALYSKTNFLYIFNPFNQGKR